MSKCKMSTLADGMVEPAMNPAMDPTNPIVNTAPKLDDLINVGGLNISQAARYIGIGETLLWEMANRNEVPNFRIGTRIVFPRHVLDQWMAEEVAKRMAKAKRARS